MIFKDKIRPLEKFFLSGFSFDNVLLRSFLSTLSSVLSFFLITRAERRDLLFELPPSDGSDKFLASSEMRAGAGFEGAGREGASFEEAGREGAGF